MCGIGGFQGRFAPELLTAMSDAIAHRGPDGDGNATFAPVDGAAPAGFTHRRLAIIDLSDSGLQPMASVCEKCGSRGLDDLALTYNGEIYNFAGIRAELVEQGHQFGSATDSEVLLHLYARDGLAMPARLNGIFAFAIRDGRTHGRPQGVERGDLFIVRDQLGVKPLYFAETRSGFVFASEMKALMRSREISRELDPAAVHQSLAYLWTPAPRTVLRGVQKLEPGYALLVRDGRVVRRWSYYDLPYGEELLEGTEDEIASLVHDRVALAVKRQLMADVPVGAFLSGGLDSSAVVAMMRRAAPDSKPRCYVIGFADQQKLDGNPSDLPYARQVAEHLGVQLDEITITPSIIDRLDEMLFHLDEPQADPAPINVLMISEEARRQGIKVLLSGAGGDDIFSGYQRHRAAMTDHFWTRLPLPVRRAMGGAARWRARGNGPSSTSPLLRRVVKLLEHADLPADQRLIAYFFWSGEEMRRSLYSPEFSAQLGDADAAAPLLESLSRIPQERDPLNRMLYLEGKHFLADHNLNYTDKMGMAAGVEIRVPLLDPDLVALAARIPSRYKQRGAIGKAIFKRAMERELPREVVHRPKTGFGAPLRGWLRNELRERVESTLSPESLRARGVFDPAAVQRLVRLDREGRVDGAYSIFALMCFELWCRQFVDAA
jgi:asparagine synthase (glutamine-hydrolysing)